MLFDDNGIKPEANTKKVTVKSPTIWKLTHSKKKSPRKLENTLNLTKMKIQHFRLYGLQKKKTVLRGTLIALDAYFIKVEISQIHNLIFQFKKLEKEQNKSKSVRRQEIMKRE